MISYKKNNLKNVINRRAGLSLIEVLIGLTVTLIVLGAMAGAFRFASGEMAKGRASLEMTNRLRTVENLLRDDLRRLTVELKPYHRLPVVPEGYAEIIDGPGVDARRIIDDGTTTARNESVANLLVGDFDDFFAGTIRSGGIPFRGRSGGGIEESHLAEVIWFTTFGDGDGDGVVEPDEGDGIRLFRRQLIVKPSLGVLTTIASGSPQLVNQFFQNNDISCSVTRDAGNNFIIRANSLQDLSRRGNRFAHVQGIYPQDSILSTNLLRQDEGYQEDGVTPTRDFNGDGLRNNLDLFPHLRASDQSDLMLSDIASFDIRVFDPDAVSLVTWNTAVPDGERQIIDLAFPTDLASQIARFTNSTTRGFNDSFYDTAGNSFVDEAGGNIRVERVNRVGAYVDLGKGAIANSDFEVNPIGIAQLGGVFQRPSTFTPELDPPGTALRPRLNYESGPAPASVFDTGTSSYDSSTILGALPLGTNGIDDNSDGIVDADEKLLPPYDARIRGLEVTIRVFEPNASQASQIRLRQSMVPE